ncbi:MAG: phosphatase PAP2 family protein [Romboutsia sp.]|nr:phosphatase PAP2 family protein [Romboutsia sp.]
MNFQLNVLKFFQSIRTPILNALFLILTISTEVPVIILLTAITYWCINKKYGHKLLFTLIPNIVINTGIKEFVKAPRPIGIAGIESLRTQTATGYSFPSGHTQTATTFWTSLMIIFKKRWTYILGTIIILGVGISRLYLGVHWPVDVIFGWIFGIVFTVIFAKLFDIVYEIKNYKLLFFVLIPFILFIFIVKSESYIKILGLLLGLIIGYIIEDKFIKFKTINDYKNEEDSNYNVNNNKNYIVKCAYRFILGIITLGILYLVLDYVMPDNAILSSIKYLIVSLYAIAGVPALFKVVKLD